MQPAMKGGLELFELVIDGNPQRLKDSRRRMLRSRRMSAARRSFASSGGAGHGLGEIAGGANRPPGTKGDEVARDTPALRFFAKPLEDPGQFLLTQAGHEFTGGFSLRRVEPQIERTFAREAEAARFVGQLIGREPQVEQNAVDRRNGKARENLGKFGITGLDEAGRRARELTGRNVQHQSVAVKTD